MLDLAKLLMGYKMLYYRRVIMAKKKSKANSKDQAAPPELQRYNHENLKMPTLTFKDRRG